MTVMMAYNRLSQWSGTLGICAIVAVIRPAHADPRAVVELFTSQGCSSCPPADKVLGELAKDPSVIALSLPIDYWDYLGWKDTLADSRFSARQKAYSRMRGDREVWRDIGHTVAYAALAINAARVLFLEVLAEHCGADLLRLKGLVNIAESPGRPAVIHGVQHVFHPPAWLERWPSGERRSRLVFIGRGIAQAWVEALLAAVEAEVSEVAGMPA